MRLLFLFFAAALIMGWYAFLIRPVRRQQSNVLFIASGLLLALLIAGFLRLA